MKITGSNAEDQMSSAFATIVVIVAIVFAGVATGGFFLVRALVHFLGRH